MRGSGKQVSMLMQPAEISVLGRKGGNLQHLKRNGLTDCSSLPHSGKGKPLLKPAQVTIPRGCNFGDKGKEIINSERGEFVEERREKEKKITQQKNPVL